MYVYIYILVETFLGFCILLTLFQERWIDWAYLLVVTEGQLHPNTFFANNFENRLTVGAK